eukprot:SAG11_NODE_2606_length_3176_cov_2.057524_4_plen_74_part_00
MHPQLHMQAVVVVAVAAGYTIQSALPNVSAKLKMPRACAHRHRTAQAIATLTASSAKPAASLSVARQVRRELI